jgi:hypothetical protein
VVEKYLFFPLHLIKPMRPPHPALRATFPSEGKERCRAKSSFRISSDNCPCAHLIPAFHRLLLYGVSAGKQRSIPDAAPFFAHLPLNFI